MCQENWRKWFQHGCKNYPKSILEGVWRPLENHPWSMVLPRPHFWWFWLHFGTPFGTSLGSFWAYVFDFFLKRLFDGLGLHLGSQNTSKMRPKRGPKLKPENRWFCMYLQHLSHIKGCWTSPRFVVFWEHRFGMAFGAHFCDFGSLLVSLLETILVTCWGPFLGAMEITRKPLGKMRDSSQVGLKSYLTYKTYD